MRSLVPLLLVIATPAFAQLGPGLGNRAYSAAEVFEPIGYIESPRGHGNATMVQGYLMVIYSSDGGGRADNGGIEFWDVSNPATPVRVVQYDNVDTHGLREAHGFSLAWYGDRLLLAAQAIVGVQIWDVTDPMAIQLLSYLDLPDIDRGDYSGGWWAFWQAPHIFLAGVDSGLFVVDASVPEMPVLTARMATGELGGVSPAQVFAVGNLAVVMESQGRDFATVDITIPNRPRLIQQVIGKAGYSHIFAGDGKILTSGNIPPRAHFFQVTHAGAINELASVGLFLDSGGYGSYQDGFFHSGFSDDYQKFRIDPPEVVGSGSSGREGRDEDFSTVLGNIVFVGDDHGEGSALIPHQQAPDSTPPSVEWMHPPDGATGLALTSRIGLSFSDHIDASSINASTIWLQDEGDMPVPARVSTQMSLVNVAPIQDLGLLASYTVVVDGVRDVAGNPAARFEATITTGDGSVAQSPTASVTNVDVNIAIARYALGIFGEGKLVYSDRDYTFTAAFPARLDGQAYIQTANVSRINFLSRFLSFDLLRPAEVLVLFDARANSIPNWLGAFTPTGETVATTDTTFDVYSRDYPVGGVELGGNAASGSSGADSMYSVVIVPEPVPCDIDLAPVVTGTITLSATGPAGGTYEWRVGGRNLTGASPSAYFAPGRHSVFLTVTDGPVSATCGGVKIAHYPLVAEPARVTSTLIWHDGDTINVNPDNGTATRVDGATRQVMWESAVGGHPTSLAVVGAALWVVDRDGARIAVVALDTGAVTRSIALPRASMPWSMVIAPDGSVFVTLSATGEVLALTTAGAIRQRVRVAPTARGLTWFDGRLYVTRFISSDTHGEVHVLDATTLASVDIIELAFDTTPDTEAAGRGVPNYVAEVTITPDGRRGFVASKKDNIARGLFRDGQPLTFESRVRAIVSTFDVSTSTEDLASRMDINDRDLVQSTLTSPLADLLFVMSEGVNTIDVFDTSTLERVSQFEVKRAPRGMALDVTSGILAVHNFLSRSVSYYDVKGLLQGTRNAVPDLGEVTTVANERLDALALLGKRIFYDASDTRMSQDGYISCASCHLDGGDDGRVWDFTQAGEGLRNTIPLHGRAGAGHGNVHWTANFDELQDFENDIRGAFGGTGFLTDAQFAMTSDPLGVPKAGLSPELDALAAFVEAFDTFPASPYRASDGTLDDAARRGREVYVAADCHSCHAGAAFSDFTRHDVGTILASSGLGIGQPLVGTGFETPTLRGVWNSAPYLHDGSAASLDDVLQRHGDIPMLTAPERTDLVAYMLQLDSTSLAPEQPCDAGPNECVGAPQPNPDAGATTDAQTVTDGDLSVDGGASQLADAGMMPDASTPDPEDKGCGCQITASQQAFRTPWLALLVAGALIARRRRGPTR